MPNREKTFLVLEKFVNENMWAIYWKHCFRKKKVSEFVEIGWTADNTERNEMQTFSQNRYNPQSNPQPLS